MYHGRRHPSAKVCLCVHTRVRVRVSRARATCAHQVPACGMRYDKKGKYSLRPYLWPYPPMGGKRIFLEMNQRADKRFFYRMCYVINFTYIERYNTISNEKNVSVTLSSFAYSL